MTLELCIAITGDINYHDTLYIKEQGVVLYICMYKCEYNHGSTSLSDSLFLSPLITNLTSLLPPSPPFPSGLTPCTTVQLSAETFFEHVEKVLVYYA